MAGSGAAAGGGAVETGETSLAPLSDSTTVENVVGPLVRGSTGGVVGVCALCNSLVTGRGVSCGGCGKVFHADRVCLGVDDAVISVLTRENNSAVSYNCCICRNSEGNSGMGGGGMLNQMLSIIGGLVSEVRKLADTVADLQKICPRDGSGISSGHTNSSDPPAQIGANTVMSEVREVYEREKRKYNIILRGAGDRSADQIQALLNDVCQYLSIDSITLCDITRVAPAIFRAKISEDVKRYSLLSEVRRLRFSPIYRNLYIQRDLTYRQRGEVIAKRSAMRSREDGAINDVGSSGSDLSAGDSGEVNSTPVGSGRGTRGRGMTVVRGNSVGRGIRGGSQGDRGVVGRVGGGRGVVVRFGGGRGVVDRAGGGRGVGGGGGEMGGGRGVGSSNLGSRGRGNGKQRPPFATNHMRRNPHLN